MVAVVAGIVAARVASVVVAAMLINFYYLCRGEYWNSGGSIGTSGKFWDSRVDYQSLNEGVDQFLVK